MNLLCCVKITHKKYDAYSAILNFKDNYNAVPILTPTVGLTFIELQAETRQQHNKISKNLFI